MGEYDLSFDESQGIFSPNSPATPSNHLLSLNQIGVMYGGRSRRQSLNHTIDLRNL
jgi:hypothetical protein